MDNTIRISAVLHRVIVGNCQKSKTYAEKAISDASNIQADIIALPLLSLVGASSGDLLKQTSIVKECLDAVSAIAEQTADINAYISLTSPVLRNGKAVIANIVLHSGEILSITPIDEEQPLFDCGGLKTVFISSNPLNLMLNATDYIKKGVQLIVNASAIPVTVGDIEKAREIAKAFSQSTGCAVALCNGNIGESTSPFVYQGFAGVFEAG
ncbi:MAG: hypothetical protein K5917_02760, partial [Clostridiales bacterium]|nr:hypothetical protein [Clostridiales bacterium]